MNPNYILNAVSIAMVSVCVWMILRIWWHCFCKQRQKLPKRCKDCKWWQWTTQGRICWVEHKARFFRIPVHTKDKCLLENKSQYQRKWWKFWRPK